MEVKTSIFFFFKSSQKLNSEASYSILKSESWKKIIFEKVEINVFVATFEKKKTVRVMGHAVFVKFTQIRSWFTEIFLKFSQWL